MSCTIVYINNHTKHSSEKRFALAEKLIMKNKRRASFSPRLKANLEQNIVLGRVQELLQAGFSEETIFFQSFNLTTFAFTECLHMCLLGPSNPKNDSRMDKITTLAALQKRRVSGSMHDQLNQNQTFNKILQLGHVLKVWKLLTSCTVLRNEFCSYTEMGGYK